MNIKSFHRFCESISGTELIGRVGPNYGDEKLPNTITSKDTTTIYCDIDDKFYTQDDYNQIYNNYLKKGGSPLFGFNLKNLQLIINFLN